MDINRNNYLDKYINHTSSFSEKDMKEYLSSSPDDMDFYKSLKKDKRTFCMFLINTIVKKQIIINTFFIVEEMNPIYLKIIILTLYIDLYFLGIALFYSTQDISMNFYLNRKEYFLYHIKNYSKRLMI